MRNIRLAAFLVMLLLLCAAGGHAQDSAPSPATPLPEKNLATVYVYRYDYDIVFPGLWFLTKTLPVYFAEGSYPRIKLRKIAGLRNKRYFVMRLSPGTYSFDTTGMAGKLKLEMVAGNEYYLRLDRGEDCGDETDIFGNKTCEDRAAAVYLEPPEQARIEMQKVKPIKPNNVQDRKLVIIPSATPSNNSFNRTRD